jgi:hypothetical protein
MTQNELHHIASLKGHPGYTALLKLLDESDGLLLEKIEHEDSTERMKELLGKWKSNRAFRRLITGRPEALYEELGGTISPF